MDRKSQCDEFCFLRALINPKEKIKEKATTHNQTEVIRLSVPTSLMSPDRQISSLMKTLSTTKNNGQD